VFKNLFKKREARKEAIAKAVESFSSWNEIARSKGWEIYKNKIEKKEDNIRHKIENDMTLTGEDLKRLQLALQVYQDIKRIPRELEQDAKKGVK